VILKILFPTEPDEALLSAFQVDFVYILSRNSSFVHELKFEIATIPAFEDESDRLALLEFKNGISEDPLQIISSWNDSTHFCNWFGVTCSPSNKRVMVLNLEDQRLVGTLTPSMGNLTYLTRINLGNNGIYGEIPQEMGRLRRLQHLNLSYNSLGGNLPTNLSHCTTT
jgi:hypothetical protein